MLDQCDLSWPKVAGQIGTANLAKSQRIGAYVIVDRRTSDPIARLCPIPNTDRFELVKYRWPLAYVWQLGANEAHA
jgi:hypothetical protein